MKRIFVSTLILIGLMLVFVAGIQPVYSAEETYNLTLQAGWPKADPAFGVLKVFAESAEKRSNGRIKIKLFADGEIVSFDQMLSAVKLGTIDMMNAVGVFWEGVIPVGGAEFGLPMAYNIPWDDTFEGKAQALRDLYFKEGLIDICREEYAKQGHYYIDIFTSGPIVTLSKTPLKTLDDWKGKKIGADGVNIQFYDYVGAKGVPISPVEVYMALKLGTIDARDWDVGAITGLNWHEVAPFWIRGHETNIVMHTTINLKKWETMPKDIQDALKGAGKDLWKAAVEVYKNEHKKAAQIVKEGKITVVHIDNEAHQKFKESAEIIMDEAAKKDAATAKAIKLIREWNAKHAK
jgi:TRAP-type C4-dicarboxylate transport system substrate-binding protein